MTVSSIHQFITAGAETWPNHNDPDLKWQFLEWQHVNSPPKKKFKTQPSVGKMMYTVFWDGKGVFLLDFLDSGQIINSDYQKNTDNMKSRTSRVRLEKRTTFLLQNINDRPHTSKDDNLSLLKLWVICTSAAFFYKYNIQALLDCWQKCIANGSDYIEK